MGRDSLDWTTKPKKVLCFDSFVDQRDGSVTIFSDWHTLLIADLQRAILADAAYISAVEHRIICILLKVTLFCA